MPCSQVNPDVPVRQDAPKAVGTQARVVGGVTSGGWRADQIPAVAERVAPDGDRSIGLMPGGFFKNDACRGEGGMIAGEVIGLQKQENPAAGLVADGSGLAVSFGAGKQKAGAAAWCCDRDPALGALGNILDQIKAQLPDIKRKGAVIVGHHKGKGGDAASQGGAT